MTHKTRISILLFFGLFGLGVVMLYLYSERTTPTVPKEIPDVAVALETSSVLTDLVLYETQVKAALITVPDTSVRISLVDGRASYGTALDGGDVTLIKVIGGQKFSSGRVHVFADIAVQSGGTGVFHYVGLFEIKGNTVTHLSSTFIGDRVHITSALVLQKYARSYTLTIHYLDRKEDDAMVEDPTMAKEIMREVKDNTFVELGV